MIAFDWDHMMSCDPQEREKAADIFGSRRGKDLLHEIGKKRTKTLVPLTVGQEA